MLKNYIIAQFVKIIMGLLTPALLRQFMDYVIEFLQAKVLGSSNKIDDALLPLLEMADIAFGIPDNIAIDGKRVATYSTFNEEKFDPDKEGQ